jgi:hypothetical protein
MPRPPRPLHTRFAEHVEWTPTCWIWKGVREGGYGGIYDRKQRYQAHRISYMLHVGPIPEGLVIDHLCRNTRCVNPDHLEAVTEQVNILRGLGTSSVFARKTHCKYGHEFTPENTYIHKSRNSRVCRTCNREKIRRYRAAA